MFQRCLSQRNASKCDTFVKEKFLYKFTALQIMIRAVVVVVVELPQAPEDDPQKG